MNATNSNPQNTDLLIIEKKNEVYITVDCDPNIQREISEFFTFYVPGYKFNSNQDFTTITDKALHDVKINAWRNKSDDKKFLVQCS